MKCYEVCPYCGIENEIEWDVEKLGFEATCLECDKRLMLCDECFGREGDNCDYSNEIDSCRHRQQNFFIKNIEATLKSDFPEIKITSKLINFLIETGINWRYQNDNILMWLEEALVDYKKAEGS